MGILDWFRNRPLIFDRESQSDEETQRAVDKAVALLNPRLRLFPGYQERLTPAVRTTIDYLRESLLALPSARRFSVDEWANEPLWRTFFVAADDVSSALSRSTNLKTLFDKYPEVTEAWFILGMNLLDHRVEGLPPAGGLAQRDIAQRVLEFSRHAVRICGKSEQEVRRLLGIQSFEYLVSQAIIRLGNSDRTGRQGLEDSRALIRARLRLLQQQGPGLGSVFSPAPEKQEAQQRLEAELLENERQMEMLGDSQDIMGEELDLLAEVLRHPQNYLGFEQESLRINTMNVVLEANQEERAFDVTFSRAHLRGEPNRERAFVLAHIRRDEMPVIKLKLDDMARYL